jgi:predicted MFS family arabinose efflux permease
MATFMTLYYVQGLLPVFSQEYSVSPAAAALTVSATTALLAFAIVPASALSERFGRVRVMVWSAVSATTVGLLLPWSPTFEVLLAGRTLQGLLCAGVPAVAMAYLVEEIDGRSLGAAMGVYVAGTSFGGLTGRLIPTLALDITTWNLALQAVTVVAAAFAVVFAWKVPPSTRFTPRRITLRTQLRELRKHLRDSTLVALFGLGFLLMGAFVTVYNFLTYRLLSAPFSLPPSLVALVFLLYLAGTMSSAIAGRCADRLGRGRILLAAISIMSAGIAITLVSSLAPVLVGVLLCTAGFFAAHSVASGWVGVRATQNRAGASSLYLLAYYLGSSVLGVVGGLFFAAWGWNGLVLYVAVLLAAGLALTVAILKSDRSQVS